jgi:DNA primase
MIGESVMSKLIPHYDKIIVLFDNDEPGIKAAQRYKDKYGFNFVVLEMSKDLSDSVKDYGVQAVRDKLFPLLKQAL